MEGSIICKSRNSLVFSLGWKFHWTPLHKSNSYPRPLCVALEPRGPYQLSRWVPLHHFAATSPLSNARKILLGLIHYFLHFVSSPRKNQSWEGGTRERPVPPRLLKCFSSSSKCLYSTHPESGREEESTTLLSRLTCEVSFQECHLQLTKLIRCLDKLSTMRATMTIGKTHMQFSWVRIERRMDARHHRRGLLHPQCTNPEQETVVLFRICKTWLGRWTTLDCSTPSFALLIGGNTKSPLGRHFKKPEKVETVTKMSIEMISDGEKR